jgi:hypothetical protein
LSVALFRISNFSSESEMAMAVDTYPAGEAITARQAGPEFDVASPTLAELARIVLATAASNKWMGRVRLRAERRWYERVYNGPD